MTSVLTAIPADVRPVLDAHYQAQLAERFGASAPGPEQEAAFAQELLESSAHVVPLMDGSVATIGGDWGWDETSTGGLGATRSTDAKQARNAGAFLLVVGLVVILLYGESIGGWVNSLFGGGSQAPARDDGTAQEIDATPEITPMALPTGLDDVVSAMGIRVPLVVPRTLEISSESRTATYPIMPVRVDVADWPCPLQAEPVACWVYGTVVNYLVGVPLEQVAPELARGVGPGDVLRLRLSTERVVNFIVEEARDVPRQNVEVLSQRRFGLTLVFLGGQVPIKNTLILTGSAAVDQDDTRRVIWAAYDPQQDLFGGEIPVQGGEIPVQGGEIPVQGDAGAKMTPAPIGGGAMLPRQELALGQAAMLDGARVTPLSVLTLAGESSLRLRVENIGQVTLSTAHWSAQLNTQEGVIQGTIEEKQISPGQIDFVLCSVARNTGPVPVQGGTWEISTATVLLTMSTE